MSKIFKSLGGFLVISLLTFITVSSCEKDQEDQKAISPKLNIEFYMMEDGVTKNAGEEILLNNNREIEIEMMRFFVSNMKFYTSENEFVEPQENLFVLKLENPDFLNFNIELPEGEYTKLEFFPGLDSASNAQNPLDFQREHPLSAFHNMHWSWSMQYRFVLLEMRVMDADPPIPCSYHPGTNELLETSTLVFNTPLKLKNNQTSTLKIGIDLNALFDGPGGVIDLDTENQAHADINNFELTRKFMKNFAASFRIIE